MRFTPTAFLGSQIGTVSATGGTTGTYTSGGVNYQYHKFSSNGSFGVTVGGDMEMLIVAGGAGGSRTGGGGGGVNYLATRIYKGTYNVIVGNGGISGSNGQSSSLSSYGITYPAFGGATTGSSGVPTAFAPGADSNCGGADLPGGGAGGTSQNGFNSTCTPSAIGGNGGEGLIYNLDGTANVYGSGGGGRGKATPGGFASGGTGGTNAGNGGSFVAAATNAVNGFGGGGGGGYNPNAGSGGNGVVIIRYRV